MTITVNAVNAAGSPVVIRKVATTAGNIDYIVIDTFGFAAGDVLVKDNVPATGYDICLLYTSPSPRDLSTSRMPSSA